MEEGWGVEEPPWEDVDEEDEKEEGGGGLMENLSCFLSRHKHRVHLFTRLLVSAAARIYLFASAASQTLLAVPRRLIAWSFVCRGAHAH